MNLQPWEEWLAAVSDARRDGVGSRGRLGGASPRYPAAFRLVMSVLSRYADHDTGANARPSLHRIQQVTNLSHETVRGALDTAERLGFIKRSGTWSPPKGGDPVTVWALGYPTPEGFQPWSVTRLHRTTGGYSVTPNNRSQAGYSVTPNSRAGEVGYSVTPEVGYSVTPEVGYSVTPNTTPLTSRPHREGGRGGETLAVPAPEGAASEHPTVAEVRSFIEAAIPPAAANGIDCGNPDLADAVANVQVAGWDQHTAAMALTDMTTAKTSPTGQAIARLNSLAAKNPSDVILNIDGGETPQPAGTPDRPRPRTTANNAPTPVPPDVSEVLPYDERTSLRYAGRPTTIHNPRRDVRARPPGWEEQQHQADEEARQAAADLLDACPHGTPTRLGPCPDCLAEPATDEEQPA